MIIFLWGDFLIKSVQKATKILTLLSNSFDNPVTITEIAEKLNLNKATCCHLIETLENEGFVTKVSRTKGYIIGPAAYCLSRYGKYENNLIKTLKPIVNYLHQNLHYTVAIAIIEAEQKYIIDYIDEQDFYKEKPRILSDNIYRTATGRAILANSDPQEIYRIYKKFGNPTPYEWGEITSIYDLYSFAEKSKKDQIFKTVHQNDDGIYYGFAAALFDNSGCVGAIGIGLKTQEKISDEENNKIISFLSNSAKIANNKLKNKTLSDQ